MSEPRNIDYDADESDDEEEEKSGKGAISDGANIAEEIEEEDEFW